MLRGASCRARQSTSQTVYLHPKPLQLSFDGLHQLKALYLLSPSGSSVNALN